MSTQGKKLLSWLLSLLILLAPLSAMSFEHVSSLKQETAESPCHQPALDRQSDACPETGLETCDCCEFSVPAAVRLDNPSPEKVLFVITVYQEKFTDRYISQPSSTPYRPPRFSV